MKFSFLFIPLLISLSLLAKPTEKKAAPDACGFETLTNSCELFSPKKGDKIVLPDGTVIPNFSAIFKVGEKISFVAEIKKMEKKGEVEESEKTRQRGQIVNLLSDIPNTLMSQQFKTFFVDHFSEITIFMHKGQKEDTMPLPWPIDNPGPNLIPVKHDEFIVRFVARITKPQFEKLEALQKEVILAQQILTRAEGSNKTLDSLKEVSPERNKYVTKMVEFAQLRIKELITGSNPDRKLSSAESNAIKKIESIRFNNFQSEVVKASPICAQSVPNAYYNPLDHSITLCPSIYSLPDTAVLSVVAHEIGHAIDPCFSQFPAYRVKADKLMALKKKDEESKKHEVSNDNEKFLTMLRLAKLTEFSDRTAYPFELEVKEETVNFFLEEGILVKMSERVPFPNYVFRDVYECLKSPKGGGFRSFDKAEMTKFAKDVSAVRVEYREPSYNREEDEQKIINAFSQYPECQGADKKSHMGETVADWISARVVGEFLSGMHLQSPLEKLGPIAFFGNLICMQRFMATSDYISSAGPVLFGAFHDYKLSLDEHPASRERLEKIFLSDPNVRKVLGCTQPPAYSCKHTTF